MALFDTHCHLDFDAFDKDRAEVLDRAQATGINYFMVPGVTIDSCSRLLALSEEHSSCYFGLGLHPYFIEKHQFSYIQQLEQQVDQLLQQNNCCFKSIGEIGLDATCADLEFQQQLLREQLQIAKQRHLPVILHHRKTLDKTLKLVRESGPETGVVHAFSGSYEQGKAWIDEGYFLGIGGTITYQRAEKTRDAIARLPLESMVLETDCPDMPVVGHQGERNEPARMLTTLESLAQLKKISKEVVTEKCFKNSQRLFNL
ncbi:TatD family hydrolase [Idiomarina seosinensis]|uniref:TatD family deoxyribonuclease n=1 Tax=Idiomarina seosinensis TaxID=281739 RepID=A0A432ZLH9_9GAMM|nr:TatD family hydrolase [Idiomarina seosinensis]RUO78082.1 TatD family deoxyribonuclease [Idiomarina seosinensis]